jgi:hypothetical protein
MSSQAASELKFDIGHVLFIDIVGYSKLQLAEQSNQFQTLREIVRGTEQFKKAEAEGKLLRLPTGDGGALVFRNSLEAPVLCALEISRALKSHPELKVRITPEEDAVEGPEILANLAEVEARTGDATAAVNTLRQVLLLPAGMVASIERLKIDPVWDPIRNEPGFKELLAGRQLVGPNQ